MSYFGRREITITTLFIVVGLIGYPELESSYVREARGETSISGSNVYDATAIGGKIFFKVSHDDGNTFGPSIQLSDNAGTYIAPIIASSGSNVYVGWIDESCTFPGLHFRASHDGGESFDAELIVAGSGGTCGSLVSRLQEMVTQGSSVYVGLNTYGDPGFSFIRSVDEGATFGPLILIADRHGEENLINIAVAGSDVYFGWTDTDLNFRSQAYLSVSHDNGASFGAAINLSNTTTTEAKGTFLAAAGSNAYSVWCDDRPPLFIIGAEDEFLLRVSHDNGNTFSSPISSHLGCNSSGILLSTEAENVEIAQATGNFNDAVVLLDEMQILEKDRSSSDLVISLGEEVTAVADTNDPGTGNVTFRWIDPNGPSVQTNEVPLSLEGIAEDQFSPDKVGTWIVEADFGNGDVVRQTLNVSFMVVPESPIGVAALMGSALAVLGGFAYFRRHRTSRPV